VARGGLEPYGALVLRVILGVVYIAHAYLAAVVIGVAKFVEYQRALHIPLPEIGVWYLIAAHGLGGILLILGLMVRWAALANIPIMAGALWFVHDKQGFFILDNKAGYEYVLVLLGATIAQALLGAGAFTLKK
jgi:putative oxidoreductase